MKVCRLVIGPNFSVSLYNYYWKESFYVMKVMSALKTSFSEKLNRRLTFIWRALKGNYVNLKKNYHTLFLGEEYKFLSKFWTLMKSYLKKWLYLWLEYQMISDSSKSNDRILYNSHRAFLKMIYSLTFCSLYKGFCNLSNLQKKTTLFYTWVMTPRLGRILRK